MTRKTAVVICPGRGTYTKNELGYLHRFHGDKKEFINVLDEHRDRLGRPGVWQLDGMKTFSSRDHLVGENSADLIYACSYADFLGIDQTKIDVVAVTGNSMGWYIACVCAGAMTVQNGTRLISSMGSQMIGNIIGGQIIYPEMDENWVPSPALSELIESKLRETNALDGHEVYNSIFFGGYRVIGGNEKGLQKLMAELPQKEGKFPLRLTGNAAFHTPLLTSVSMKAKAELGIELFNRPCLPLIDGRGKIWSPYSTSVAQLWDYTLGHQVDKTYDFSKAVEVAVKEFAPDYLIVTGPGTAMGGAVAQVLIQKKLRDFRTKEEFKTAQKESPYILSVGDPEQRQLIS